MHFRYIKSNIQKDTIALLSQLGKTDKSKGKIAENEKTRKIQCRGANVSIQQNPENKANQGGNSPNARKTQKDKEEKEDSRDIFLIVDHLLDTSQPWCASALHI
jgi:hypothetical protein